MRASETKKLNPNLPIGYIYNYYHNTLHNHEYYEFFCIIKGKALNIINGNTQLLEPKNLLLIRSDDIHCIRKIDEFNGIFQGFNIPIPLDFIEKEFDLCPELKTYSLDCTIPRRVTLSSNVLSALEEKVKLLIEMQPCETRNYLYYKLIQELCGCLLTSQTINERKKESRFSRLISDFENLNGEELTYDTMLKISNVSATALWKMFKKELNISPSDYIKARRAEAAYNMLINSDKSLLDIAMQSGYGSYIQFYRDIKSRFNMNPKEIRNNE